MSQPGAPRGFTASQFWLIILLALPFALSFLFVLPAEDAVILYEYARNLRLSGVVTYGGAGVPIEGATDFLWMILITLMSSLRLSEFSSALLANFLASVALCFAFKVWWQRALLVCALVLTPYLYSSLSGFSTIFFVALYIRCLFLVFRGSPSLYAWCLLLCLVRPDGLIWCAGPIAWNLYQASQSNRLHSDLKRLLTHFIAPGLLYFICRAWYFSEWLPLPFLVKASGRRELIFFFKHSLSYVSACVTPIALTLVALGRRSDFVKASVLFLIPAVFYSAMNLEQNIGNRFLAPMFFGFLYYSAEFMARRATATLLVSSIVFSFPTTIAVIKTMAGSRYENFYNVAIDLARVHGRMLISEAGRLSFYSRWRVDDSWGLNTPRFARRMIAKDDVTTGNYDLIVAHCDFAHIRVDTPINASVRGWDEHCKVLTQSARDLKYDLYVVPVSLDRRSPWEHFKQSVGLNVPPRPQTCLRHDLFAVSPAFKDKEIVEEVLKKHGGFRYSNDLTLGSEMAEICL